MLRLTGLAFCLLTLLLWQGPAAHAQARPTPPRPDSLRKISIQDFFAMVTANHPVVKQANLLSEMARSELRIARGYFDPKLGAIYEKKEFKGTPYYNHFDGGIKVPTWFGLEFKAGYEENLGSRLNPELTRGGVGYAGVSLPLLQNLLIDQRRATLRQARLLQDLNEAERVKAINKIILSAAKDYWNWYQAWQEYQYTLTGYTFAFERFRATRQRAIMGEAAIIDTTEALITAQTRESNLLQAQLNLANARLVVSNYLWNEDQQPLEMSQQLVPDPTAADNRLVNEGELQSLLEYARNNHPELVKVRFKLGQLDIDRRLALEFMKPQLNLSLVALSGYPVPWEKVDNSYIGDNYKLGIDFFFPLFLRKERGKLQLTRLKIQDNELYSVQTNREIQNNVQAVFNELKVLEQQLGIQRATVSNYERLRQAEISKLQVGESSLFLVNTRETQLIDSQIKLAALQAKYQKSRAELLWAAGRSTWLD